MNGYEFLSWEHASQYLSNSIIRLDERPIYCIEVVPDNGTYIRFLELPDVNKLDAEVKTIKLYSERVDISPIPLGLVNYSDGRYHGCIHLSRIPSRSWKIGLTTRNSNILMVGKFDERIILDKRSLVFSEATSNTVLNKYPSPDEAQKSLNYAVQTLAFSRNFAIGLGGLLYYKRHGARSIGWLTDNGLAYLYEDYSYLMQQLEKDGVRCL